MKQKTAIRQLIEDVELIRRMNDSNYSEAFNKGLDAVINIAKGLESVNEQQIKDAYKADHQRGMTPEIWFNETFEKP